MLDRLQVSNCCFFLSLKVGCIAIGAFGLFLDFFYTITAAVYDEEDYEGIYNHTDTDRLTVAEERAYVVLFGIDIAFLVLDIVFNGFLIFGTITERAVLLIAYVIFQGIIWLWTFCILIYDIVLDEYAFLVFFDTLTLVIYPYFLIVVYSHYRVLQFPSNIERLDSGNLPSAKNFPTSSNDSITNGSALT